MGRFSGKKCRLLSMLGLTITYFFVEIIVGYVTNSMALVADSFHMLSDIVALLIAFFSIKISPKKWSKNTFGWARAEVLGALTNSVFLTALCFSLFVQALKRFYEPEEIHNPELILYIGILGLIINLVGLFLLKDHGFNHGHSHKSSHHIYNYIETEDSLKDKQYDNSENTASLTGEANTKNHKIKSSSQMNMRGAFLHVLADALGSVVVIISAVIIWQTDWEYKFYVDPALSVVMVFLIVRSVWPLMSESALILLQTVPTHIQIDAMEKKLLSKVDGVLAVHEFHVWQLAGDRIIASAHIKCLNLSEYMRIAEKVKEFFHNEGIHSTTIQPEFVEFPENCTDCSLYCPASSQDCRSSTCCPPPKVASWECRQRLNSNTHLDNISEEKKMSISVSHESCV